MHDDTAPPLLIALVAILAIMFMAMIGHNLIEMVGNIANALPK